MTDAEIAAKNALADSHNPLGSNPNPVYTTAQGGVTPPAPVISRPIITPTPAPTPDTSPLGKANAYLNDFQAPETEAQIIERKRLAAKDVIDSVNKTYDTEVATAQEQGKGRLSQNNALSVFSGLAGSPEASTKNDTVVAANNKQIDAINNERSLKIASIYQKISDDAYKESQDQITNATNKANAIVSVDKEKQTQAVENARILASSGGVDFESFKTNSQANPEAKQTYDYLLKNFGGDENVMKGFFAINKPTDTILDKGIAPDGKTYYQISRNPITGALSTDHIDLGINIPPGYDAPQKIGDSLVLIPKGADANDPSKWIVKTFAPSAIDAQDLRYKTLQADKLQRDLNTPENSFKFTNDDNMKLINSGLTASEVTSLQSDIQTHGADVALKGLSDAQQKTVRGILSGGKNDTQFLTPDFLKTQFANTTIDAMLKTMGKDRSEYAKFFQSSGTEEDNIKKDFQTYIDGLTPTIESYRQAGYTDKEILNLMK